MEPRTTTCLVRLTAVEKAEFESAADAEALTMSAWIRQTLLREVARRAGADLEQVPVTPPLRRVDAETNTPASIRVPVSESELETVRTLSRSAGLPVGRWARLVLQGQQPRDHRLAVGDQELVDQLRRIGTNLNQLTRLANGGQFGAADGRRLLEVLDTVANTVGEIETRLIQQQVRR